MVPRTANILSGRFVLAIKSAYADSPLRKARFVVQCHRANDKHLLVHNASTARRASVRLLVSLAAMKKYALWIFDGTHAYLQSAAVLTRQVYVHPPEEIEKPRTHLLRFKKRGT